MPGKKALLHSKKRAYEYISQNRLAEANELLAFVCKRDKTDIGSWSALGSVNFRLNNLKRAEACFRHARKLKPGDFRLSINLGAVYASSGRLEEAIDCFQRALRIQPKSADAYYNLGNALMHQRDYQAAIGNFRHCIDLAPGHTQAWINLGAVYRNTLNVHEAIQCYENILEYESASFHALTNLGAIYKDTGRIDAAIEYFSRALEHNPRYRLARSSLVFTLNNHPTCSPEDLFKEHRRWGKLCCDRSGVFEHHDHSGDPNRVLRVGYLSPDLKTHSVAFFLEGLLARHEKHRVEAICYAEVNNPDATTKRLRSCCRHWRVTCGLTDSEVAGQVHADRIDILVDLAGHTANSRLAVLALKPAPVQVSYLGYPNTTGLPEVDYRLTDEWADPTGRTECFHTERLVRLPHGFLCYSPPAETPAVSTLPARNNGWITFGSFNSLSKINGTVVSLWARILEAVPGSKLVLKNPAFADTTVRQYYLDLFSAQGVAAPRLTLLEHIASLDGHLAAYNSIDLALDTFPYNGTTTTCESLWMGVPVITLTGHVHAGRVGVSLLNQLGMKKWIARDTDDYLDIAVSCAGDLDELNRIRRCLRDAMRDSPLCDASLHASEVEEAYREMWRTWCATRGE